MPDNNNKNKKKEDRGEVFTGNVPYVFEIDPNKSGQSKTGYTAEAGESPTINLGVNDKGVPINFGKSRYDFSDLSPESVRSGEFEYTRGELQPISHELANMVAGGVAKIPFTVIGNVASILDFEDYYNTDNEVGNSVTAWTEEMKGNIEDATKIYKSNDNTLSSREWWLNNGKGLIDSAGGFVLTGGALGKGVQLLSNLTKGSKIVQGLGTLTNAAMLNQAESIPIAMNVYQNAYNVELDKLKLDVASGKLTEEQADLKAQEAAADAASYSVAINRINIPLNLTSAGAFLRTPALTRQIAKDVSKREVVGRILGEGTQEYIEENVNMIAEKEAMEKARRGKDYTYNFDRTINDVFSKEGLETGLVGFIGGGLQTGGTSLLNSIIKDAPSYDSEGNVRFDEIGAPVMVSKTQSQRERYQAQQNSLKKIETLAKTEGLPSVKETLDKVKVTSNLLNDLQIASLENNEDQVNLIKNELLTLQALDAFKNGTTEQLLNVYRSISRDPQSKDRLGDEYATKAHEAIRQIEDLEKIYIKHQNLPQVNSAFNNRANYYFNIKTAEDLKHKIFKAQAEQLREIEVTGFNTPELVNTLETTKELQRLNFALDNIKANVLKLNQDYNNILSGKTEETKETPKQEPVEVTETQPVKSTTETASIEENIYNKESLESLNAKLEELSNPIYQEDPEVQKHLAAVQEAINNKTTVKPGNRTTEKPGKTTEEGLFKVGNNVFNSYQELANAQESGYISTEEFNKAVEEVNKRNFPEDYKETHIEEDEVKINTPVYPENAKKAKTAFKSNNSRDDGSRPSNERFYRYIEKNPLPAKFLVVTKNNNPKLYNEVLSLQDDEKGDDGLTPKEFEAQYKKKNKKDYQGVYLILADENNALIKSEDKILFSTLSRVSRAAKGEILIDTEEMEELVRLRDKLLSEKENVYLPIVSKSEGIPEFEPRIDNVRQSKNVVGRIVDKIEDLDLQLPTQGVAKDPNRTYLKNGQIALTGKLYAFDETDRAVDLIPRTLNTAEIDLVANLINQRLGVIEKTTADPSEELEKIIYFGVPKIGPKDFTVGIAKGTNVLNLGKETLTSEELSTPEGQTALKNFLANKRVDVNVKYSFDDKFTDATGKSWDSYKEYLTAGDDPMFGTDLKPKSEVQFRNQYLIFDNKILKDDLRIEESIDINEIVEEVDLLNPFGEVKQPTKQDIKHAEDTTDKLNKIFKKKTDGKRSLDRIANPTISQNTTISEEEVNWFNNTFPNIPVKIVKGLIDNQSFGRFMSAGEVLLSDIAPVNTLRHEAFHTVTQLYLNKNELNSLYKETRDRINNPKATDLEIEEILAEDFANYKNTGKILSKSPVRNNIFKRLLDFIKDLLNFSANSIEDIYRRLDNGYYTNKDIVGIRQFTRLDKALPGKSETFIKEVLDGIDAIFFDILFENNRTPSEAFKVHNKITDIIYDELISKQEDIKALYDEDPSNEQVVNALKSYNYILENWNLVLSQWDERAKSLGVEVRLEEETDENIETSVNEEENINQRSGEAYQEANQISTKTTMSEQSKMLIRSLKQKNTDGSDKLNSLGLPAVVNFNTTYNFLLKQLSGLSTYEEIYNKIKELSNTKPEFVDLVNRLGKSSASSTVEQFLFQQQFRQDFAKNQNTSYITLLNADGNVYIVDANKQNNAGRIAEKWRNNLRYKAEVDANGNLIIDPVIAETGSNLDFLNNIGFELSKETLEYLNEETPEAFTNAVLSLRNYITDNKGNISKLFDRDSDVAGRLEYLANLEAEYSPESTELSFISTEGKTVYSVGYNNALSIIKNIINNSKTKQELFNRLPHLNTISTEGSVWLDQLFDKNGIKKKDRKLNVDLHDGVKTGAEVVGNNKFSSATRKISAGDKYVQELTSILLDGRSSYIRASDKSSEHVISLNKYGKSQKLAIPIESVKTSFDIKAIKDIFNGYFKSEFKRIALHKIKELGKDLDVFNNAGSKWTVFEEILSADTKKRINLIIEELKAQGLTQEELVSTLEDMSPSLYEDVSKDIVVFLNKYSSEIKGELTNYNIKLGQGLSKEAFKSYSEDQLIRAAAVNDLINSIEQTKLFIGDMAFYKDLFKRTSAFTGTKKTSSTGVDIDAWLNNNNKRLDKKIEDGKINVVVFEDVNQSLQAEYLNEYIDSLVKEGISQDEAENILKAYTSMDEGDAQGWITLDELRSFELRMGSWTLSKETLFDKVQKGETLSKDELVLFTVKKAQYAGPQEYNTIYAPAYHKYSLLPLIPQMVKGKNLEKVLNHMTKNQIGYGVFKSGSKVGTKVNDKGKANKFYTDTNNGEINTDTWQQQVIYYDFLGLQTDTPKPKDKVIFGTQFRKLLFSNAFEGGKETFSGAEKLLNEYNNIIDSLVQTEKAKLIEELGLDPDNYTSKDVSKLVELLQKEARERNLADNLIESLQSEIIKGKLMLKYKFDAMVNKSKIDSMVVSLVNSRLIKQKINGDALIQVASSGFESIGKRNIGTNDVLKFYRKDTKTGKTLPAQVMIPLSSNYKTLLKQYKSLEEINKAIKNNEIDKKILELVAYRIPTQGLNSMEYFEVVEFLPEEASTSIVLPTAIVAKSGGDYDVDKLNVIRPNISFSESKGVKYLENTKFDKAVEALKKVFNKSGSADKIAGQVLGEDFGLDKFEVKAKQNRIIEIAKEILTNPSNFSSLITPNSNKILTSVVDELRYIQHLNDKPQSKLTKKEYNADYQRSLKNIRYTNQLKLTTKVQQFIKFLTAKDMIGITAVQNTHHILAQQQALSINLQGRGKLNLDHNITKDGLVNISKRYSVDNSNQISEIISQILTSAVDAAKDPFVFDLNMTTDTLGIYLYLIRSGVPFETAAYFMTQPIITEYLKTSSINKSGFLKAVKKTKTGKQITTELRNKYRKLADLKKEDKFEEKLLSKDELKNYLYTANQNTKEFYTTQLQVLDDYLTYKEHASLLSDAIRATNQDTAGVGKNLEAIRDKTNQIQKAIKDKFVNGIEDILKKSLVKSFDQLKFTSEAFSQFYYTQTPEFQKVKDDLMNFINPFSQANRNKLASLVENDLINFVVQNWGYENVTAIKDKIFKVDSVARKIINIKSKKNKNIEEQKIADNLLIQELYPMLRTAERPIDNIKIYAKRYDSFTANQLTEAFRELKDLDPQLSRDLMDLGILQSGLNNSPITFLGIIPYEYYNELTKQAFANFDKKNGAKELYKFKALFLRNNRDNSLIYSKAKDLTKLGYDIYGKNYELDSFIPPKDNLTEEDRKKLQEGDFETFFKQSKSQRDFIELKNKEFQEYLESRDSNQDYIPEISEEDEEQPQFKKIVESKSEITKETNNLIKDLTSRLGVEVELISDNQAKDILGDKYQYSHGFYYKGKTYLVDTSADTIIHEMSHPFIDTLANKNFDLFQNIIEDVIKEHSDIYETVEKLYPEYFKDDTPNLTAYKEMAVRAITKLAIENPPKKSALEKLWEAIKSIISDIFGSKENILDLSTLSPNSSIKELADLITSFKGKIDIVEPKETTDFKKREATEEEKEAIQESPFKKQLIFFNRRLSALEKQQSKYKEGSAEYNKLQEEIDDINNKIAANLAGNEDQVIIDLGTETLAKAEEYIKGLEAREAIAEDLKEKNIKYAKDVIDTFEDVAELSEKAKKLKERLYPFIQELSRNLINRYATEKDKDGNKLEITQEMIDSQNKDTDTLTRGTGSLSDSANYIARTIGLTIKEAQNKVSTHRKKIKNEIEKEVKLLEEWGKKNGVKDENIFDVFIQEHGGTLVLTKPYLENSSPNPNYEKIQNTPELKRFYEFYQNKLKEAEEHLPLKVGKYFIPNIAKSDLKTKFKNLIDVKTVTDDTFIGSEGLYADIVHQKFLSKLEASKKSRDLANILLAFSAHSKNYTEMSEVLPEVRLLQEQLKYKLNSKGKVIPREYIKSSDPTTKVAPEESNIYKMAKDVIEMQVKGNMKLAQGKIDIGTTIDENGKEVKKYVNASDIADLALKYNSMLRIGFSPITATANVLFGDVSNIIEAVGGRFFNLRQLHQATKIFALQNFGEKNKDSEMNKWLEKLNPLQELDDYESVEKGVYKKLSPEKFQEYMYSMQKSGEKFLQSRTMLAVLIKDGYMTPDGKTTEKGENLTEKQLNQLSDKIQRLNQLIHGRYSQREAATWQQNVAYRMAIQFRKWIPAAIENRIGIKKYDVRLGVETEGRYRTFASLIFTKDIMDNLSKLMKGELSELEMYNMRKMLTEITLWAAGTLLYSLVSGDDEEDKKRRKNPIVKTTLTLLNRVSGDIAFFYSPGEINNLAKNAVPLAKTTGDLISAVNNIPAALYLGDYEYKSGSRKGKNKFYDKAGRLIPGINPILGIERMLNEYELEELK